MATYLVLKALHVLAAVVFLGTGLGSAWYRDRADRSGDLRNIAWAQREIVRADLLFTVPSALLLPLTGAGMVWNSGLPWTTGWILAGFGGYLVAGLCWLPAFWLQIELRKLADRALEEGSALPPRYRQYAAWWRALGVPSFLAAITAVWVMVAKHAAW